MYIDIFKDWDWLMPDGSCVNYDRPTKSCKIYSNRPDICKANKIGVPYEKVEQYCDKAHMNVYGVARERGVDCEHVEGFLQLQLETTSTCNAGCHFCPYPTAGRAGGVMDMALFKSLIDQSRSIPQIKSYTLQGLGEPTLDRFLVERIRYIYEAKPEAGIELFTNGVYMHPARFDACKAAGLNSTVFSLNAISQEQHKKIMDLDGKFDIVCRNIDHAIANRGDMSVQVHAVINGIEFTNEDSEEFYRRWGHWDRYGHGKCVIEGNWAGDSRFIETENRPFKPNECCNRALDTIYVMYDGRVSMCCFDPTGKTIWGDLNKQTIKEVYNSQAFTQFREDHNNDRADRYEQCANCTRI